jgi:hypothetical protein
MEATMCKDFEGIQIDGSFVRELIFALFKTVRMSLIRAPGSEREEQLSVLSSLQFDQVHRFRANFDAAPWLEITAHHALSSSDYLEQYQNLAQAQEKTHGDLISKDLRHFQIVCEEGEIDIIAERFTFLVLEKIPHVGQSD